MATVSEAGFQRSWSRTGHQQNHRCGWRFGARRLDNLWPARQTPPACPREATAVSDTYTDIWCQHFLLKQGHCGACRRKWRLTDTDLYPCGETQTMSHIVESCPLTKLNGGLSRLHSADKDAVSWLTSYGSWHAYEKKIKTVKKSSTTSFSP